MDDYPTRRLDDRPDDRDPQPETDTRDLGRPPPAQAGIRCPECSGRMVRARGYVRNQSVADHELYLEPEIGIDVGGRYRTECRALVCLDCGFTKFYARHPRNLLK